MATLSVATPIVDGDTVTSQTLHDLIENASISGLTGAALGEGATLCVVSATAPSSANYKYWWDSNDVGGQVLRVYASPWNIWVTVGPERVEVPLVANEPIKKGALVVAAGHSLCGLATRPSLTGLGFAQDTALSGTAVPIAICGLGFVSVQSGVSNPAAPAAGQALVAQWTNAGDVATPAGYNCAGGGSCVPMAQVGFGVLLEQYSAERSDYFSGGARAIIWGPKVPA